MLQVGGDILVFEDVGVSVSIRWAAEFDGWEYHYDWGGSIVLLYLAISKGFEPLLLLPIAFGCLLANIPGAGISDEGGLLYYFYTYGLETEILHV